MLKNEKRQLTCWNLSENLRFWPMRPWVRHAKWRVSWRRRRVSFVVSLRTDFAALAVFWALGFPQKSAYVVGQRKASQNKDRCLHALETLFVSHLYYSHILWVSFPVTSTKQHASGSLGTPPPEVLTKSDARELRPMLKAAGCARRLQSFRDRNDRIGRDFYRRYRWFITQDT